MTELPMTDDDTEDLYHLLKHEESTTADLRWLVGVAYSHLNTTHHREIATGLYKRLGGGQINSLYTPRENQSPD